MNTKDSSCTWAKERHQSIFLVKYINVLGNQMPYVRNSNTYSVIDICFFIVQRHKYLVHVDAGNVKQRKVTVICNASKNS